MSKLICIAAVLLMASATLAKAQDATALAKAGASEYRLCAACHSLMPGVHLSGPSLASLWGKKPAANESYRRYTEALKTLGKEDQVWDEDTLNAWLADPQAMAPGTTMTFQGIENDQTRAKLIAFLRVAMAEGGGEQAVKDGLIPKRAAEGQIPPDLSAVEADQKIKDIRHCRDAFYITTMNGAAFPVWETNLRIKIDSSRRGPGNGEPVLLRSGMGGDRMSVVFSSLAHVQERLAERC